MGKISGKLTVFFEDPFWIGIFEKITDNKLSVCKVTFGSEPKDYQIYDFILKKYDNLKFSDTVSINIKEKIINPKRLQREISKTIKKGKISTKSQEILKSEHEKNKIEKNKRQNNFCKYNKSSFYLIYNYIGNDYIFNS